MVRVLFLALVLATPPMAAATVLYKSVDANGTITFSDMPPSPGARILEERKLPSAANGAPAAGLPQYGQPGLSTDPLLEYDAAIARASEKVDLAEHALAEARRGLWSPRDGLRLDRTRMTREDEQRVEFYKRNVTAARHALMELLRERRNAQAGERRIALASNNR